MVFTMQAVNVTWRNGNVGQECDSDSGIIHLLRIFLYFLADKLIAKALFSQAK